MSRANWAMMVVVLCVVLMMAAVAHAGEQSEGRTSPAVEQQRPTEHVSPAPEVNPDAVVWRTPELPANPQAGDVWVNPKDGSEMVYLPAGEFILGTSDLQILAWLSEHPADNPSLFAHEQPQCRVNLPAYWVGRTEVTNAEYLRFVRDTGHGSPEHWESGRPPAGLQSFPVVYVSWEDARAYCKWVGGRLPTELEWEKAARGTDGRIFPWGNEWDKAKCQNFEVLTGRSYEAFAEWFRAHKAWERDHDWIREGLAAVGAHPAGGSPYGCQDMAGNVSEWCEDWRDDSAYRRYATGNLRPPARGSTKVLRGGSWRLGSPRFFYCANRNYIDPEYGFRYYGFRCARDAD